METLITDRMTMCLQAFKVKPSSTKWRASKQYSGSRIRRRRSDNLPPILVSILNPTNLNLTGGGAEGIDAKMQRPDPRKHPQTRPRHGPTKTARAENQTIHNPIVQTGPKKSIPSQTSRGRDPHFRPRVRPNPQTKLPSRHQ